MTKLHFHKVIPTLAVLLWQAICFKIVLSIDSIMLRIKSIVLRTDLIVIKLTSFFICATFGLLVCKIDSRLNYAQNVLNCDKNQLDCDKNWLDLCYIRLSCQQNWIGQKNQLDAKLSTWSCATLHSIYLLFTDSTLVQVDPSTIE